MQLKLLQLQALFYISLFVTLPITPELQSLIDYIDNNVSNYNASEIKYIADTTGFYWNVPFFIISACVFYLIYQRNATMHYNKVHNMQTLIEQEQRNWNQIMPIVKLELIKQDVLEGPWAMALTPLQFVKKYNLVEIETVVDRKSPWKTEGVKKMKLRRNEALEIFRAQMGPLWEGVQQLQGHRRALFALFLARIEHDTEGARQLTKDLAISYSQGTPDFSSVTPLLNKHSHSKAAARCIQNHAYVLTVLASMLSLARTDGVLASSDFLWLKPIDRELWYMLNNMGRQTAFCEVAGPWAHLIAENELGRPLFRPIVDKAVDALEDSLSKILFEE
jgi:intracellular multiplication protein IcmP